MSKAFFIPFFIAVFLLFPLHAQDSVPLWDYCYNCHINQEDARLNIPPREWSTSIHNERGVTCDQCHGLFHTKLRDVLTKRDYVIACLRCHKLDGSEPRSPDSDFYGLASLFEGTSSDVKFSHGIGGISRDSLHDGKPEPAVCADCHEPHGTKKVDDPSSWVYTDNVEETCAGRGDRKCHDNDEVAEAYGIVNAVKTYEESFHGKQKVIGMKKVPICTDCHAFNSSVAHAIKSKMDPSSPVNMENVGQVCSQCHGKLMLTAWITPGTLHADSTRLHLTGGIPTSIKFKKGGYYVGPFYFGPFDIVVYTYRFMVFLLLMVMSLMLSLFTLDLARKISERRHHGGDKFAH